MSIADRARVAADVALEATVVGSFSRAGFAARGALFSWADEPEADLAGRVALVTGANSGIGLATAHALARGGAEVWLVGRDSARLDAARLEIEGATPSARVRAAVADLAVLDDVRACAALVQRESARLDVVVHNAGALVHSLQYTADGLELTVQVHVVAPFLLTASLLAILRATPGARVVTVSSGGMYTQRLDLAALATPPVPFDGVRAYANAKRAQVVLNERWAREPAAAGITFHAMHPGWVDTPGIRAGLPRFHSVMRPLLRSADQGADSVVWLASAPAALESNGKFWLDRRPRPTSPLPWTRTRAETAEQLWRFCAEHTATGDILAAAR